VVSFLREYGNVGSVDKPDDYIDDTQLMSFGRNSGNVIAYFTGRTERTTFALAGSSRHLIGASPDQAKWPTYSTLSAIWLWMLGERKEDDQYRGQAVIGICDLLRFESENMPNQRLEFFAKRLLFEPSHDNVYEGKATRVLLATPLYVAMTD
jgi:hypothetical protein